MSIEDLKRLRTSGRTFLMKGEPEVCTLRSYDEHRCIFVHIPKTAGLSIAKALFGNAGGSHVPLSTYERVFDKAEFDSYFKFAFVRNPWDRVVSAYAYLIDGGGQNEYDEKWGRTLAAYDGFEAFVTGWLTPGNVREQIHFLPQHEFVCTEGSALGVDFVGRFERIEQDFESVRKKLGIGGALQHLNASKRQRYASYYNPKTIGIVADVYQKDIELFGYDFEGSRSGV